MESSKAPDEVSVRIKHINRVRCAGMCDVHIPLSIDADTMRCIAVVMSRRQAVSTPIVNDSVCMFF